MKGEIVKIAHGRIKATISLSINPLEIPEHVVAHDPSGGCHYIPVEALDVQTLERLTADFRAALLRQAGYGHVVTLLG
jgi:hypothetical protein